MPPYFRVARENPRKISDNAPMLQKNQESSQ